MITEEYVSFETAKLLKERGFDLECLGTYSTGDQELSISSECPYSNDLNDDMFIAAPTQQMATKWLREVYNIYITVLLLELKDGDYGYVIEDTISRDYLGTSRDDSYQSPEEAAEIAIKYCLENLI